MNYVKYHLTAELAHMVYARMGMYIKQHTYKHTCTQAETHMGTSAVAELINRAHLEQTLKKSTECWNTCLM